MTCIMVGMRIIVPPTGNGPFTLVPGRYQPLHTGHVRLIESCPNPLVLIIDAGKRDRRRPFTLADRAAMMRAALPGVPVITATNGYLPDIIVWLADNGIAVNGVIVGDDRAAGYERQVRDAGADPAAITIHSVDRPVGESASAWRAAADDDDIETLARLTPAGLDLPTVRALYRRRMSAIRSDRAAVSRAAVNGR